MATPRILLVPMLTELEWRMKPQLEEWAEVASYDAPGIEHGSDASPTPEMIAEAGLRRLDELGWERCVVVADEFGVPIAARIVASRPDGVQALALGHARLSNRTSGQRAPVNSEVLAAFRGMAETDYRSWVRAFGHMSGGSAGVGGYEEDFVERYLERVRPEVPFGYIRDAFADQESWEQVLASLAVPMLLVEHRGCLLFTAEGYEDAATALPGAETASIEAKPSTSLEFAERVRALCNRL